jgi:hypothetical protein
MSKIAFTPNASGTGTFTFAAPNSNSDRTLTLPDATGTLARTADIPSVNPFTLGTAVASTSGTAIDFTGIPSWAKRVTVMFAGVSTNGTSSLTVNLGTSAGLETSGYLGSVSTIGTGAANGGAGLYFFFGQNNTAASVYHGSMIFSLLTGNNWVMQGIVARSDANSVNVLAGSKALAGALDRISISTVIGNTFDAGTINVSWEG